MKTLLKLLVVAAVLNAAYRFGMSEYRFSQLTNSITAIMALGTRTPVEQIREQIMKRAGELGVPLSTDRLSVGREGVRTTVTLSYHQDLAVFPGYKYPRDYQFSHEIAAIR